MGTYFVVPAGVSPLFSSCFRDGVESYFVPEPLPVVTMTAFDFPVLRRLARRDEVVSHSQMLTCPVEEMKPRFHRIGTLGVTGVIVGKDTGVVSLDRPHGERGTVHNHLEKLDGSSVALLTRRPQIPPPGAAINGGELKQPSSLEFANIDHINFDDFARNSCSGLPGIFLLEALL